MKDAKRLKVRVLSPEGILYEGDAESVRLPGALGSFSVLPRHAPLIAQLTAGTLLIGTGEEVVEFEVGWGIVEVFNNQVTILVERAKKK